MLELYSAKIWALVVEKLVKHGPKAFALRPAITDAVFVPFCHKHTLAVRRKRDFTTSFKFQILFSDIVFLPVENLDRPPITKSNKKYIFLT
jgi:hypothetical protein